jgi:4-hydroxy-tetrahydrodipicolinate synthase
MEWQNIKGVIVSSITTFNAKGEVDEKALRENWEYYLSRGAHAIGVLGTCAEDHLLNSDERKSIVELARSVVKGRGFLVAGSGMIGTKETVEMAKLVEDAGADVALVLAPFYRFPTEEGTIRHFKAVSEAVDIPIMVYNMPPITTNVTARMLERLCKETRNVRALKDSSRDMHQFIETVRLVGDKMAVGTGEDDLFLSCLVLGAPCGFLAGSNIAIDLLVGIYNAVKAGKIDEAKALLFRFNPLMDAYMGPGFQANLKEMVRLLGRPAGEGERLPLLPTVSPEKREILRNALKQAGLL